MKQLSLAGLLATLLAGPALTPCANAQDRLKTMPGYERYERLSKEIPNSVRLGALSVTWRDGGQALEYQRDGQRFRYDLATRSESLLTNTPASATNPPSSGRRGRRGTPAAERVERGRQYTNAIAPSGEWRAFYRDGNVWLTSTNDLAGTNAIAVTTDGCLKARIKFGTANWVYGEELDQNTALWWNSNSTRLAFYRFDETRLLDYYLTLDHTKIQTRLDVEPYMKAGAENPEVDLFIYDPAEKTTVRVDVRSGEPFANETVGHYVYGVRWSPDGPELLFHRTNRRQNILELCAADRETGAVRVIVREEWPASWTENSPTLRFLADGRRFIWASERTGWRNFYLYDLGGTLLATLTAYPFEVAAIEHVDEAAGVFFFTARSGDNPMKLQLHRATLTGTDHWRLTDPAFHHTVNIAPDGRHFVDIAQTHNQPPTTTLRDAEGALVAELARSDLAKFNQLGLKPVELFRFKAADGATDLYGLLHFPSNFRPGRKYPLLISTYAGPGTVGARETFTLPSTLTELGFLVASLDSRSASGRGKRFLDAIYQQLGRVEVDDQAAGVRALHERRYVDARRVGIHGTSYGGFVSLACLLRYPELFQAASASSAVTDFRNYDTIYTERYLGLPQEHPSAYEATNLLPLATNLQGRLLIFYGTADNNVHPANALQLIAALQKAGKSFEVQVGPDQGHTSVNRERMMEFFIERLVMDRPASGRHP